MKKLLFVTATLEPGGVASVLSDLSLQLNNHYDITILLNDDEKISYPYAGKIITLGIKQQDDRTGVWYQLKVLGRRVLKLRKLKKTHDYAMCISMLDSANIANILSGKKHCKTITTVYSNISAAKTEKRVKYLIAPAVKGLYNKSDYMIITSEGVRQDLKDNFNINEQIMKVIYDGVKIDKIREKSNELINPEEYHIEGKRLVSSLGRLDSAKAQWHMIRAMSRVVKICPDVKLLIMGSGQMKEALAQLIHKMNMQEHIELCGYVENPFKYIAKSKAFVLSSVFEGYPTVLLEAMVCGTPCVCTDFNSGAREVLAPATDIRFKQKNGVEHAEYGVITPVCDGIFRNGKEPLTREEEFLADAMLEMLQNEELNRNYCEKIRTYSESFSIENCAKEWENVIETLC